jgi:hypothetical protein
MQKWGSRKTSRKIPELPHFLLPADTPLKPLELLYGWVTLIWMPYLGMMAWKDRRSLRPCHSSYFCLPLDCFYMKNIAILFKPCYFGFSALCSHSYSSMPWWNKRKAHEILNWGGKENK